MKNHIFLFSLISVCLSCATSNQENKQPEEVPVYVRKNAHSQEAAADLEALKIANEKMREMDCSNPLSWYYQGAIHLTPDSVIDNRLCPQYQRMADAASFPGWRGCTHDAEEMSRPHFLTWHRLYIWYYEKIVRKLSGKEDFALPYWEYTNAQYRVMPEIFRDSASSLFVAARLDSLNLGHPIREDFNFHLDPTHVFENVSYKQFNVALDDTPHGPMHGYIGGSKSAETMYNDVFQADSMGYMASLSTAGFDPVFFVHHANIDYLWEVWNQSENGAAPIYDSLNAVHWDYIFFDENGEKVQLTTRQVLDTIYKLDYRYDILERKELEWVTNEVIPDSLLWINAFDQVLDKSNNRFAVESDKASSTFSMLGDLQPGQRLVMHVNVSFSEAPISTYNVFLNLNETNKEESYAGGMSFFGAKEHLAMMDMASMFKTFEYDVTDELAGISTTSALTVDVREIGKKMDESMKMESVSLYLKR
ncbi:MAG: tyrosinase family protein [Bacteroidota bacterium]